jgi:predicted nuclease of restriction endonuclease-like (RecB) superfamily
MRKFYLVYKIYETASRKFEPKLSWSHYVSLLSIDNEQERNFYEIESIKNHWTVRELNRQVDTAFYHRIALNKKDNIDELGKVGHTISNPKDVIKDPFVLEFLGLDEHTSFTETELESKIIDRLEKFLLELGKGFAFVARQQRISFDHNHFYIDLVFYNWILKCFVVIDLKIGQVEHKDLGQIQIYVNYYDCVVKTETDNKTIGIVLARRKSDSLVEYALPEDNTQIFASKYQLYLPSKEELKRQLENLENDKDLVS